MPIEPGWPCALLASNPPSVIDRLSEPTGDDLTPQVLALTPRGPAWGTDEAGDGQGASPVMRGFWRAIAGWAADIYRAAFDAATQSFPSAVTWSIEAWEREYGLPDPCFSGDTGMQGRVNALRARFGATGGASQAYLVCLAASVGYDIAIDEWAALECGATGFGEEGFGSPDLLTYFFVTLGTTGMTWITFGREGFGENGFGTLLANDLICVIERVRPLHTQAVYDLSGATP